MAGSRCPTPRNKIKSLQASTDHLHSFTAGCLSLYMHTSDIFVYYAQLFTYCIWLCYRQQAELPQKRKDSLLPQLRCSTTASTSDCGRNAHPSCSHLDPGCLNGDLFIGAKGCRIATLVRRFRSLEVPSPTPQSPTTWGAVCSHKLSGRCRCFGTTARL